MARTLALTILIALAAAPASAQDARSGSTTRLIPYAATLPRESQDGTAGARAVTFALFDDAEGGTLLWNETQTISVDARGRFSAHLGASVALPLEIFRTEQARWLEVTVDGRALPRTMLVAVPYALRAADAETLAGRALSEFVLTDRDGRRVRADGTTIDDPTVDGTGVANQIAKWSSSTTLSSSIITESFDNRLGVLAPDPTGGGVVDSRVTIRNPDNNTALGVLNPFNQRRFALNTLPNGSWTLYDGLGGGWNAGLSQAGGTVGIGGFSAARLHVVTASPNQTAVQGNNFGGSGVGVQGTSSSGLGVSGSSNSGIGVSGLSQSGPGIRGQSVSDLAGEFIGNVSVSGTLTKGAGSFQIDHPLDPANKYLRHSFVESPDMMNVYNGNAALDANGEAWVTLPEWFGALNRDFRYQLTPIGAPAPNLHIAAEIRDNRFRIAGGRSGGRVSWQVTGIRQDAFANANRIPVESDKPAGERGFYLHPNAFDLPASLLIPSLRVEPIESPVRKPQCP